MWAFCSVVFTRHFPNHSLSLFQDHNLTEFCCSETFKTEERVVGHPDSEGHGRAEGSASTARHCGTKLNQTEPNRAKLNHLCSQPGVFPGGSEGAEPREREARQSAPRCRCAALGQAGSGGRGGRSPAALPSSGRGPAMEAAARLGRLRREAAEYYRGHRVPERMEEALNALFPLCPEDLYGELVARGGEAAGRGRRGRVGARRARAPSRPLPSARGCTEEVGISAVTIQWFAPWPGQGLR